MADEDQERVLFAKDGYIITQKGDTIETSYRKNGMWFDKTPTSIEPMRTCPDAKQSNESLLDDTKSLSQEDIETLEHNCAVLAGEKDGQLKSLYPNLILPSWMFGDDNDEVPLQPRSRPMTAKIEVVEFTTTKPEELDIGLIQLA